MSQEFPLHGLTGNTKRLVFEALFQWQDGKCFICGISQAEIYAKYQERLEQYRQWAEKLPEAYEARQWYQRKLEEGPAPVHRKLHIDHCHTTGAIRGLLCEECNSLLGVVENFGLFEYYSAIGLKLPLLYTRFKDGWGVGEEWLEKYRDIILLYMQPSRWLPRKDILFHLQIEVHREAYQEVQTRT